MGSPLTWHSYYNTHSGTKTLRHNIRLNTVDRLKQIVNGLNEECFLSLSKSGRKQELIDRVVDVLGRWKMENNIDRWNKARAVINQIRNSGLWVSLPPSFLRVFALIKKDGPRKIHLHCSQCPPPFSTQSVRTSTDALWMTRYTPSSGPRSFTAAATATNYGISNNVKPYTGHVNQTATSSTIGRYDAYAPPRRPGPSTSTAVSTSSTSSGPPSE